ncbi:MAG: FAD-dependent oxidoreductase, partial [Sphingopyxis sp.]|nr:FAD-dependent oxidoreductase [Sphingopyxis sp.]
PALMELGGIAPGTPEFTTWGGRLFFVPAFVGGVFGLLGGYLTDRLGRRRVLTWSILLYAFSALAAAYSTSVEMLLFFRCTTFVGVCVEFVAAVAWLAELFPQLLGGKIVATRQEVLHFGAPQGDPRFTAPQLPVWADFNNGAIVYGIPDIEGQGFKLAFDDHGPRVDPDTHDRRVSEATVTRARAYLAQRFPALADAPLIHSRVCQYENSSNGDFLIDRLPGTERVWLVGGGSGHGFKHGPAVGKRVAAHVRDATLAVEPRFSLATKGAVAARTVF